eukprot:3807266-Lingulodinium_polyedra.AAC.1
MRKRRTNNVSVGGRGRETNVCVSTPEAELVPGSHGFLRELLPALGARDKVSPTSTQRCSTQTT